MTSLVLVRGEEEVRRQRSEQNRTWGQSRAHFFRHAKGLAQATQIFVGKFGFLWAIPWSPFRKVASARG